ncbi:sulfite exporter TauE/SafE family protein [Atopomonas sediminilitoris]|uniref:sulfite exporter TauE/SafE family protein n=1 Tax=Atopomonas sediminilitoris TaxID=2919919 RepID=UPI001F4D3CDC|nr:sulfite exporter TauE/SafE family protein [Atopomonas sediminilitoris]MCJ8169183.1 sulfite exporter TauE/SafE family protein [Atopomonas sediminilitoris]
MNELLLHLSAFVLGLLGAGHCLGMCGGLMGALTLAIPAEAQQRRLAILLSYNLGRIASYSLAGLLLGLLGWAAHQGFANVLRGFAAALLFAMGLYLAGWWQGLTRVERLGQGLWRYLQPLTRRFMPVQSLPQALTLGALWGWLPCGLVYSTLLWSASQGSALTSMSLMAAFGLGTLPLLVLTGLAAEKTKRLLQRPLTRQAAGILVMLFAVWTFPGPHQQLLMGH